MEELIEFLENASNDPRLGTAHISVYVYLWRLWINAGRQEPIRITRQRLVAVCKISGYTTFHKTIRELSQYDYIGYLPSFNRIAGSQVYITRKGIGECHQKLQFI